MGKVRKLSAIEQRAHNDVALRRSVETMVSPSGFGMRMFARQSGMLQRLAKEQSGMFKRTTQAPEQTDRTIEVEVTQSKQEPRTIEGERVGE